MDITAILTTITFVSAILLIILVLLQQRGASLGAGLSGSGELYTERRGLEKSMFNVTVVVAVVFIVSILAILITG
ncbi:preprotein translocase subunit SecG [Candidatus Saccharibacteria bacterium]|nr:preprotein translocase subunit SecG [Candidatus Saccharibacteria bacterium]